MQLHSYNSTESSYSETLNSLDIQDIYSCKPPQRLHYFWERQCDISPDAIALICEKEFTYRVNIVHIKTVTKFNDARFDFVQQDTFFSTIFKTFK